MIFLRESAELIVDFIVPTVFRKGAQKNIFFFIIVILYIPVSIIYNSKMIDHK